MAINHGDNNNTDTKSLVGVSEESVNTGSPDHSLPSTVSSSELSIATHKQSCKIPASPWPVYIVAVLYFLPISINETTLNSVLYNKLCYEKYYDTELCSNKTFTQTHPELQDDQAKWTNYISLIELPCGIVTNLLLSSYCDKIGHKLPLVLAISGNMLSSMYLALLATKQFLAWPMASVLAYGVLNRILGGFSLLIMAEFSYIALITPLESRAFHMAVAEGTMGVGFLIGTAINGVIIDNMGLDTLAYLTACVAVIPFFLALVFVRDVLHTTDPPNWREVVGFSHVLDAFKTIYKKREGYNRVLLNLSFVLYAFPFVGMLIFSSGSFLYFVKELGFSMTEYSIFNSVRVGVICLGSPLLIHIIRRIRKVEDLDFAMGCNILLSLGTIIMSQPSIPASVWIGGIISFPQGAMYALIRAIQTKICGKDELGRLFAFDAIMQCVLTTCVSIGGKFLYTESLAFWPSMFIAISAFMLVCSMIVIIIMSCLSYYNNTGSTLVQRPTSLRD